MSDNLTGYQIFDSYEQPMSRIKGREDLLWDELDKLVKQSEAEGSRITYAIGKILADGSVTYDF